MTRLFFSSILSFILFAGYSNYANITGYVPLTFHSGHTIFHNPLEATDNHLSTLFSTTPPPGTTISFWNPSINAYDQLATYDSGGWSQDVVLAPGTGARLYTSATFVNTFVGTVLNPDGTEATGQGPSGNPPAFFGPDGIYLLGCKAPLAPELLTGSEVWMKVLGRQPEVGEQLVRWNATAQEYYPTATFMGNADWDNNPQLNVGEAAFFVVPEPSLVHFILIFLGIFGMGHVFRRFGK